MSPHPQDLFQFPSSLSHYGLQFCFRCSGSPVHMVLGSVPGVLASGLEKEDPDPPVADQRAGCPTEDCSAKKLIITIIIIREVFFNALQMIANVSSIALH